MNTRIANGKQVDLGLAKDISDAVKKLSSLRDEGQTVGDYQRSEQFENDEYSGTQTKDSAAMREILAGLDENKGNVKGLTDFLKSMVRSANEQGDARQESMFGESEKVSAEDIIKSARKANKPDSENTSQENVKKSNEAKAEKPKADLEELTENEASIYTLVPAGKGISVDELLMKSDEIFEEPLSVPEVLKILDNLEQKEYIKENDLGDYVRAAKEDSHLSWIEKHPFKYNNKKSVEQNMEAAEKLAQEYLAKFNDTTTINTEGRKNLRRQIIDDLYGEGAEKKERKAFIVMGLPASGKSSAVAEPLAKEHGAIIIDSDLAKEKLPEFQLSNGVLASVVHNESSKIAFDLSKIALENGDNVVFPVVGTNTIAIFKNKNKIDTKLTFYEIINSGDENVEQSSKK